MGRGAQALNPSSESPGMAAQPPASRASAQAPRCHSIHRPLGPLAGAGTNQQALKDTTRVPRWSLGGPCLCFLSLASQCFFPRSLCVPAPLCFPCLDFPLLSVVKSGGVPCQVIASTGRAEDKALLSFHSLFPQEKALEQLLDQSRGGPH